MSAVNSLPSPEALRAEPQQSEPSMEEILASIRRIIADDHSLPEPPGGRLEALDGAAREGHRGDSAVTELPPILDRHAPRHGDAAGADASLQRQENEADRAVPPREAHADEAEPVAALAAAMAHGSIAAPQFASPDGPLAAMPTADLHRSEEGAEHAAAPDHLSLVETGQDVTPANSLHAPVAADNQSFDKPMRDEEAARGAGEAAATISGAVQNSVMSAFNMLAAARLVDDPEQLRALVSSMVQPMVVAWLNEHLPSLVERVVREEIERVARGAH